jgi:hypothetical protein
LSGQKRLSTKGIVLPTNWTQTFKELTSESYIWSPAVCGAENLTCQQIDQKYLKVLKFGAGGG